MSKLSVRANKALVCIAVTILLCGPNSRAQTKDADQSEILAAMTKSAEDWNRGDIAGYVSLYKNSPETLLVGPKNIVGYGAALAFFSSNYDTAQKRGILSYSEISVQPLDARFATVTGRFHLQRSAISGANIDGYYLLVFERTNDGWKVVRDDSSVLPPRPQK